MKARWLKLGVVALIMMMHPALVGAVSLGRIDVASHLGEPFFAVIPLKLDDGESLSSIFVDLATPVEYRFLEVYREDAVSALRTAIKQDAQGFRVELSSVDAIQSPFMNLVLRVRFGRATHFKKFAVFLALPKSAVPDLASKQDGETALSSSPSAPSPEAVATSTGGAKSSGFTPFSGWARTNRYGPMVYGDTLLTVARRLRVDKRYSIHQVAVALFNKNRDKFSNNNINLVKAGSYLDTPTAAEVAALTPVQATRQMQRQVKQWKAMMAKNVQYAQLAKAQKNRYSKRVRVGAKADGMPASGRKVSTSTASAALKPKVVALSRKTSTKTPVAAASGAAVRTKSPAAASAGNPSIAQISAQAQQRISSLKSDNELLQATVTAANARVSELEGKLAAVASNPVTSNQGAEARIKKLEARLMRMQRQLSQQRQNDQGELLQWVLYGAVAVIVLLLVVIGVLLRRQPQHPAQQVATTEPASAAVTANEGDASSLTVAESAESATAEKTEKVPPTTEEEIGVAPSAVAESEEPSASDDGATLPEADVAKEDVAKADVDYLAEAEVYLRYGMESEAEEQVNLALQQRPDDPLAHAKLVEVRRASGDQAGVEQARSAALAVLGAEAVALFQQQIGQGDAAQDGQVSGAVESSDTPVEVGSTETLSTDMDIVDQVPSGDDDVTMDASSMMDEVVATANDVAASDVDDDLEALLADSGMDSKQQSDDEDDDVLDLSIDGGDDDLDALIASLEVASDEPASELDPGSASKDDGSLMASQPDLEEVEATSSGSLEEVGNESIAVAEEVSLPVETTPAASAEVEDADALDFDLSGVDMSKADKEEPLVNNNVEPETGDLDFALDGMDLSGISLPGAARKSEIEPGSEIDSDDPLLSVTETPMEAGLDEPALPVEEPTVDLDAASPVDEVEAVVSSPEDSTFEVPVEEPTVDLDLDVASPVDEIEAVVTSPEDSASEDSVTTPSPDSISLDMDDLDMLLAEEEVATEEVKDADASNASPQSKADGEVDTEGKSTGKDGTAETKSRPAADGDDEMRTLLDGLDDLDFSAGEPDKS